MRDQGIAANATTSVPRGQTKAQEADKTPPLRSAVAGPAVILERVKSVVVDRL